VLCEVGIGCPTLGLPALTPTLGHSRHKLWPAEYSGAQSVHSQAAAWTRTQMSHAWSLPRLQQCNAVLPYPQQCVVDAAHSYCSLRAPLLQAPLRWLLA
jgi:hypothetical protein